MTRFMTWTTAVLVVAAGFAMITEDANAGLFGRKKAKCCCQPVSCCEPAPCCPQPAPCCEPAPAPCGCSAAAPACGCECHQLTRREIRKAKRNGCCIQQCSCCQPVASACGCEAAPACGCAAGAPCGCEGATTAPASSSPEAAPELPADAT